MLSPMYELVFPKVSSQARHGSLMHVAMCVLSWCSLLVHRRAILRMHSVGVQVWVAKGLHAAATAKIAHLLEDWEATQSAAGTALQQLRYTHFDTSMYWHLEQMSVDAVNNQADGTTEDYW